MIVDKAVLVFNDRYKVGDTVKYKEQGKEKSAALRWPAEVSETGRAVCWLAGVLESTDLNNIIE